MPERFSFDLDGIRIVGDLYLPDGAPKAAVVTTGPLTSVKEQATGAYAAALADQGFAALSFDHRYFGESGGEPRQYEDPEAKIADISAAVSALQARFPGLAIHALGVCAGGGYMAGAVAAEPRFRSFSAVAGFFHDAAQMREWSGAGYDAAIAAGAAARADWEATGTAATIPAVAMDGDRAMPLDEAFAYYGTDRGGEATYPNYRNAYALMSREKTTGYDAQAAAGKITRPVLMIHSENALSPMLARRFHDALVAPKTLEWVASEGQIDFYDDPALIGPAARRIADFIAAL